MAYLAGFSHRGGGWCALAAVLLAGALAAAPLPAAPPDDTGWLRIDRLTAQALGERIWRNEGRGDEDYLLWWNEGEQFASLGIGHFIWYPTGETGRFHESFPGLLSFLVERGVRLPRWLAQAHRTGCPWPAREAFLRARGTPHLVELRELLAATVDLQAQFIVAGLEPAYHRIVLVYCPANKVQNRERGWRALARRDEGEYREYSTEEQRGQSPSDTFEFHLICGTVH
jgi:hypothetical protein